MARSLSTQRRNLCILCLRTKQLVQVYKSKVLSFVEYHTPAVYHATKTTLAGIDAMQRRILRECGLSDEDALLHFNLAPL